MQRFSHKASSVMEKKIFKGFYHIWPWRSSWSMDGNHFSNLSLPQWGSKWNLSNIGPEAPEKSYNWGDLEHWSKLCQSHCSQNIGQGHQVKVSAESVHWEEALCKVWWLFFCLFFFYLGFTALSRIFHLYRADRSSKVGENRRTRRKTTWPSVSQ